MKTTTILPFSKDMKFLISRKLAKQGLTGLIFFYFPSLYLARPGQEIPVMTGIQVPTGREMQYPEPHLHQW